MATVTKAAARAAFDRVEGELIALSHRIHAHPEIKWEEERASAWLGEALDGYGFAVESGICDLPTAFQATAGSGPLHVVVCAEYDALPGIGHACGHNIIAATAVGTGVALAAVADDLGLTVRVMGTPAEEGGGGKILMARQGAFDGVDAAMMVHPADQDLDSFWAIAIHELTATYRGRSAHAAAAPHLGVNALDAAVLGYMGVAALRQHIESHERIHGVFTHGGDKANIVPDRAVMQWYVRSGTTESLARLKPRVVAALEAGALATGATLDIEWKHPPYADIVDNASLLGAYARNLAGRGRGMGAKADRPEFLGSTDMGDVSHLVPSIHPMIAVAPPGIAIHTPEFAEHARSERGDAAVLDGAVAMAQTVVDLWSDPALLPAAQAEFQRI